MLTAAMTAAKTVTQDELLRLIEQAAAEGWTELNLSGRGLTELPPEIGKLTKLETLILGEVEKWMRISANQLVPTLIGNRLITLPTELKYLTCLTKLNLSGNALGRIPDCVLEINSLTNLTAISIGLQEVPETIAQLSELTVLDLSGNQIQQIPEEIAQLSNLTKLYLFRNQITHIPEAIGHLSNLAVLNLFNNQITQIPDAIAQLSNLTMLSLAINQITQIPGAIAQLSNLTTLSLSNNQITQIPDAIAQLSNLTTLSLSNNQITQIPDAIAQLSNLTTLSLSNNQITHIPEAATQLFGLTTLDLFGNQITHIPEAIAQLSNLKELNLSGNRISKIPNVIAHLSNIEELYLTSNRIREVPDSVAQLTNLIALYLPGNQVRRIPETITQLTKLIRLSLSGNQISEIPKRIMQLTNLTELYLDSNQISEIPEAITQIKTLERLSLARNEISKIPETIIQLSELNMLNLENNKITEIPVSLESCPKLTRLDLRRNPLPISPEILGPSDISQPPGSAEDLFRYLHEMRSGEKRQLNEAKLLLIGQGSVGKTSLVNRLINDNYNPHQSQTDGLTVSDWEIDVNTKPVRLHVWDFGGQEIYHATHQFFLTKRSLYILTCNCRTSEDENRIEYWLKLIDSFGGESPVIIVGNKSDEQPLDINRKALRDKYPNIAAILETSCSTGHGIADLRAAIIQQVAQLHDVYNLLPLTWFQVKEQLEDMDEDFITYPRYTGLCHTQNVTNEDSQEQLIDLLHNLGLVLNFREHPILKDTNVLNPDWVTTGIYALLSDETLKTKNKGILTAADLERILDPQRYPAKRYPYLTELMKEFQLGFLIDGCEPQKFLIPGLLPKGEPTETDLEGDTLDFQYHYRILPDSIISRFIVLAHEDIHQDIYWRSGVMLHYKEGAETYNIARIKADPEEKQIFIAISGKASTRRAFLATIRKLFTKIHRSFVDPEITEWVPVPGHPDHPPLDYQELLGLEKMGIQDYPIGKLGIRVNIRQLLDGYEPLIERQQRRHEQLGKEGHLEEERLAERFGLGHPSGVIVYNDNRNYNNNSNQQSQGDNKPVNNTTHQHAQGNNISVGGNVTGSSLISGNNNTLDQSSNTIHQHGQGDNIGGDKVMRDKIGTQINNSTDLATAARDIKALFAELDQSYDKTTPTGQMMIAAKTVEAIENQPTVKKRLLNAVKEGGTTALEEMIEHPAIKPVVAAIKGYIDA